MFVRWVIVVLAYCSVCKGKQVHKCEYDQFPCDDGTCVHKSLWCDSSADCDDDSDEMYCFTRSGLISNPNRCDNRFFLCKDGRCIPIDGRCDGYMSCRDNSDEENCGTTHTANSTEFSNNTSTAQMKLQMVETGLPLTTLDHINFLETTESSDTQLDLMHADTTTSQNINYSIAGESASLPDSVQTNSVSENATYNVAENYVGLHGDIVKALDSQSHIVSNVTSKSVDFHNFEVTSPVPLKNIGVGLKPVDVYDILQDAVSENPKTTDMTLKNVDSTEVQLKSTVFNTTGKVVQNIEMRDSPLETASLLSGNDIATKHVDSPNIVQADSIKFQTTSGLKEEDIERGFIELNVRNFRRASDNAQQWLLKVRDEDYGWGDETSRALTALYLSNNSSLKKLTEKLLMSKQFHLKLFTALIRNQTNPISLGELSLYINALAASCENPKNFYGQDLVDKLRQRTNTAQSSSKFVSPFVYLTLCLNNVTTYADVKNLQEMRGTPMVDKIDIEALVSLAASCMSRIPMLSSYGLGHSTATTLLHKVIIEGLPENIYELALVTQALNEAHINQDLWNRSEAMSFITSAQQSDGSFSDILSTYYVMPILSGKSLLSLSQHCHHSKDKGLIPLEVLKNSKNEKTYVHYSLFFGDPVEVSQTLMIKVQKSSSFLDIMRIAETINPLYRFRYDMSQGKPTVYSIGEVVNDAERGMYWILHVSNQGNSTEQFVPYKGDIRSFVPGLDEYVVFWMKSIF